MEAEYLQKARTKRYGINTPSTYGVVASKNLDSGVMEPIQASNPQLQG